MKQDIERLDSNFAARRVEEGVRWVDVRELGVEGRGFGDVENYFDRWPGRAKGVVPENVWALGQHSAGMRVRFVMDAGSVSARWTLRMERLAMDHMPATGVSGLDLYTREKGAWRWLGVGRPTTTPTNQVSLASGLEGGKREMMLYLPLYNGVTEVLVGVPEGAVVERAPAWDAGKKPVCFYGTSIVHGGCALCAGMSYPAIVSRRLDWPHFNFGFSGNGRCERAVAELLAELEVAAYVVDALPNMTAELVEERMEEFVGILRAARREAPIVLVENILYRDAYAVRARRERWEGSNRKLREVFERMVQGGVTGLHYVNGEKLLGEDGEGTVDGTHPTDLGFWRMAEVIGEAVRGALNS